MADEVSPGSVYDPDAAAMRALETDQQARREALEAKRAAASNVRDRWRVRRRLRCERLRFLGEVAQLRSGHDRTTWHSG
jgi:hypothetical protein